MCGICGEVRFDGAPIRQQDVVAMRDELTHRGPDSIGLFVSPRATAGLGFRRLRIIDLSPNGSQPMANESGSVQVIFNGEIYNFRELRQRLLTHGHQFRSQSDTEVIAHLYEEKGADCIGELEGMFAIAIWDEPAQRLTLARDRAGKKPVYFYRDTHRLAFASEIKSFFAHPEIAIEPNRDAIPYHFIHGYVPGPATLYQRVFQLEPGTLMTLDVSGAASSRRYWHLEYPLAGQVEPAEHDAAVEGVRERTTRAVERRLISDVPLGAFLSGGVDSTIVVGLMSRLMSEPVKTFSIGFEGDKSYDETGYARIAAERFKTDHTEFRVSPSAIDLIDKLNWHYDGPCGDSSAIPTYIVSQLTREKVTVVLTGDGGDEVFAGYLRFYAAVLSERIPRPAGSLAHAVLSRLPTPSTDRHWFARAQRFFESMGRPLHDRMTRWNALFYDDLGMLLRPEFAASIAPVDRLRYIDAERSFLSGRSTLSQVLHANFTSYLPDDLLVKTDRCTMAHSLEARAPFLDRELVEYVARLPDAMKLDGRRTKAILRDAFADLIPPEIQTRGKMGFGVPLGAWFRADLRDYVRDLLLSADARYREYLSAAFVEGLLARHLSGTANLGQQLWTILCFEAWLRRLPDWTTRRRHPAAASIAS